MSEERLLRCDLEDLFRLQFAYAERIKSRQVAFLSAGITAIIVSVLNDVVEKNALGYVALLIFLGGLFAVFLFERKSLSEKLHEEKGRVLEMAGFENPRSGEAREFVREQWKLMTVDRLVGDGVSGDPNRYIRL